MTIVYRSVKGSNLTPTEVDNNFHDVDNRITTIEATPIGRSIDSIDVTGNIMTITYSDATTDSFELPMWDLADLLRGAWQPSTPYVTNEIVTALGNVYVVTHDHTSDLTFDPNEADTGGNFYALLLKTPAIPVFERSGTTFTPAIGDANSYNRFTNPAGCVVTIPEEGDVNFELYTELHFRQAPNAGVVSIDEPPTSSVLVINPVVGYLNETAGEGATFFLKKVGSDEWDIGGLLAIGTA